MATKGVIPTYGSSIQIITLKSRANVKKDLNRDLSIEFERYKTSSTMSHGITSFVRRNMNTEERSENVINGEEQPDEKSYGSRSV